MRKDLAIDALDMAIYRSKPLASLTTPIKDPVHLDCVRAPLQRRRHSSIGSRHSALGCLSPINFERRPQAAAKNLSRRPSTKPRQHHLLSVPYVDFGLGAALLMWAPMLIASDLHTDFIVDAVEDDMDLLAVVPGLAAGESIVYILVLVLSITFGSPGEQRAFVMLASPDPFFIPVWAIDDVAVDNIKPVIKKIERIRTKPLISPFDSWRVWTIRPD